MAKKIEIEQKEIEAPWSVSGVEPYELPEGWKWVRLGDVVETSKEKTENFSDTMKYIGLEHIDSNGKISGYGSASEIQSLKNVFHQNQILYGKLRPYLNKHDIADFDGVCSTDILVFNAKDGFSNKYVNYFFNLPFFIDFAVSNSKGINLPRVSESTILNISFPLPPTLSEQQRIVNRIESMFAKLDEAKEKAQNVVDSFETRKAAILHQSFTGNLTAKWRKENGVSDDSWKYVKLEDIVKKEKNALKAGPFGSSLKKEFYVSTGYKIYGQEQVLNSDENYGDYFIDEKKYKELESCKVSPNDVLISLVGTVGKTLILSENCLPGIINPRLIKISLDLGIMIPQFFTYYFGSDYCKNKYKTVQHGTTMDVLNMGILKSLDYPCCSLNEQQEIVRILDTVLEKEHTAKSAAEQVLEQIDLLKKSILARAFRGEL